MSKAVEVAMIEVMEILTPEPEEKRKERLWDELYQLNMQYKEHVYTEEEYKVELARIKAALVEEGEVE